jgi:hypothetical protein
LFFKIKLNKKSTVTWLVFCDFLLKSQLNAEFVHFLHSYLTDRGSFTLYWQLNFDYGNRILFLHLVVTSTIQISDKWKRSFSLHIRTLFLQYCQDITTYGIREGSYVHYSFTFIWHLNTQPATTTHTNSNGHNYRFEMKLSGTCRSWCRTVCFLLSSKSHPTIRRPLSPFFFIPKFFVFLASFQLIQFVSTTFNVFSTAMYERVINQLTKQIHICIDLWRIFDNIANHYSP